VTAAPEPPFAPTQPSLTAVVSALLAGAGISLQMSISGRFAQRVGSAEIAGMVNSAVGLAVLLVVGTITGVPGRAAQRLARRGRPRVWHLVVCVIGGIYVTVGAYAAPRVGVARLTIALVCGQCVGSLLVDRVGLTPGAKRPFTAARLAAVALALVAVVMAGLGSHGHVMAGVLGIAVAVGAGLAVQQAAMGHIAIATGEPLAAAVAGLACGLIATTTVALVATGGRASGGWGAPPLEWTSGIVGASVAVVVARIVPRIGVLRLMLALVAGQSVGALFLDIVAPPPGGGITASTVGGVLVTVLAVLVSGASRRVTGPVRPVKTAPAVEG
jgi:bacterial/archaeal transporter family-2 protein